MASTFNEQAEPARPIFGEMIITRCVALDTETTGLSTTEDRLVEIGCVEIINNNITGNHFHCYLNPGRPSSKGAARVHGLQDAFLRRQPKFTEIADRFLFFVSGSLIIAHNAPFDLSFIDKELVIANRPTITRIGLKVQDSYTRAQSLFARKKNSLDALCDRFKIPRQHRGKHGALLDAQLLAQIFLAMNKVQAPPLINCTESRVPSDLAAKALLQIRTRASEEEADEHKKVLQRIDNITWGYCNWLSK